MPIALQRLPKNNRTFSERGACKFKSDKTIWTIKIPRLVYYSLGEDADYKSIYHTFWLPTLKNRSAFAKILKIPHPFVMRYGSAFRFLGPFWLKSRMVKGKELLKLYSVKGARFWLKSETSHFAFTKWGGFEAFLGQDKVKDMILTLRLKWGKNQKNSVI